MKLGGNANLTLVLLAGRGFYTHHMGTIRFWPSIADKSSLRQMIAPVPLGTLLLSNTLKVFTSSVPGLTDFLIFKECSFPSPRSSLIYGLQPLFRRVVAYAYIACNWRNIAGSFCASARSSKSSSVMIFLFISDSSIIIRNMVLFPTCLGPVSKMQEYSSFKDFIF